MNSYFVEETTIINAPAHVIYNIISDYDEGHQAILPRNYFNEMIVTKGGKGAGTEITVHMTVIGIKATYHMVVTEPEPGKILKEEDVSVGTATTFTVEPFGNGAQSQVTIHTKMTAKSGLQGWLEKLITPPTMRRIYREELTLLAKVAEARLQPTR